MGIWGSSGRPDERRGWPPYTRRRARAGFSGAHSPDDWTSADNDPAVRIMRWGWRYRAELGPGWAALGLALVGSLGHDLAPAWWPLALPLGAAATAAAWHWRADRLTERVYVLAVGIAATLWTAAAWWASIAHDWLFLTAVLGVLAASLPRWWHYRRRGKITVHPGAPRGARRELRRLLRSWPELAEYMELGGSHVQRAEADKVGVTLTLALRAGLTVADVVSKLGRVESVLETRPGAVRVMPDTQRAHRAFLRIVKSDPLARAVTWPGTTATSVTKPIALAVFEDGEPVHIRLLGEHVLIGGAMGRGKSGALNVIVAELSARSDVVLWAIDLKGGLELAPWLPVLNRLATTPDAARELLLGANRVLDARARLLAERRERKWQPSPSEPALVVLVDELAELDEDGLALFERLARLGRALVIILVAVTQRPSAAALGSLDARTQLTVRVCLGVVEARDTELILGQGRLSAGWRAERLGLPGSCLVLVPGQHELPRPARVYWLSDEAVSLAAARYGVHRPSLDVTSAEVVKKALEGRQEVRRPKPARDDQAPEMDAHRAADQAAVAGDLDEVLLTALREAPHEGLSADDLARSIGRKRTWVYERLRLHQAAGRVEKLAPGRWRSVRAAISEPDKAATR